ncbi:MAG TPA: EamA family transporter [Actinomycetota bacterium]|nr:EamA family transporter [Actinomycetota bacterium]
MSGAVWAALAGIGFGVFQTLNRRTLRGVDVFRSTFVQLLLATAVLAAVAASTENLGLLGRASAWALLNFALAGVVHFLVGWTLLATSQQRIGASRTSPLVATTPLFGALLAFVTLGESPSGVALAGMSLMVAGVYTVGGERAAGRSSPAPAVAGAALAGTGGALGPASGPGRAALGPEPWSPGRRWGKALLAAAPGLGAALSWSVSPVFIRAGLRELPSPLLGVTFSMVVATAAYGAVVLLRRSAGLVGGWLARGERGFKLAAGVLVGLSTWFRWIALERTTVAVVLALSLLAVPTVMVLAPPLLGRHLEVVTPKLWAGAGLIVAGALLLILRP